MLQTYLRKQYPKGKVRTALKNHTCNGSLDGRDPGCGGLIAEHESYFDTNMRNEFFQAGRFCKRCALLEPTAYDLFDSSKLPRENPEPLTQRRLPCRYTSGLIRFGVGSLTGLSGQPKRPTKDMRL